MAKDEEYQVHRYAHHPHGAKHIGTYQNKTFAYNKADKLDNEYGAVAHHVKRIPKEHESPHWGKGEGNKDGDVK